jgi:hypothetical protein
MACFRGHWPSSNRPVAYSAVFTFFPLIGTIARALRSVGGALGYHGENHVIGKAYFARQAAILFGLAKATTDPKISAALLDKAAELQVDKSGATPDLTPRAPDVGPPSAT